MTEPTLLHAGFDGLDLAYRVTLPAPLHTALEAAQVEAVAARRQVALTYQDKTFLVNGYGGKGGYAFSVDTGVMGANWWFKRPGTGDRWGARVSSRALPLALNGIEAVKAEHDTFLEALGMTFSEIDCRVSRIDYAVDFLLPDFKINPADFVTHAKRSKALDGEFASDYRGEKLNGIRIGKMPNSQIAIYDKRREVLDSRKFFWWDIWREKSLQTGIKLSKKSPIWRFEFRAGKDFLEKACRRKTWEAITTTPNNIFGKIAAETRLAVPQADTNRARWPNTPVWEACRARLSMVAMEHSCSLDVQTITAALWADYLDTIGKQTAGLIISQACAYGINTDEIPTMIDQIKSDVEEMLTLKGTEMNNYLMGRKAAIQARYSH